MKVQRAVASRSADRSSAAPPGSLTIGEVARRSGFSIKARRFYERRGLLPASGRSAGGFRLYSEADLHRLEFIRQAKALGLQLDKIRELLVTARERTCSMTRPLLLRILDERLRQTSGQIETLTRLKKELLRRRRTLARRPPTDHGRGYCACFEESGAVALVRQILFFAIGHDEATARVRVDAMARRSEGSAPRGYDFEVQRVTLPWGATVVAISANPRE